MTRDELTGVDENLISLVKSINDSYDKEDRNDRDAKRPLWTKLENYFNGLQRIYYDYVAKDWRNVDKTKTSRHYDKVINSYRAHGEAIIAALSVRPPTAIFYPDDADVEEDNVTAKVCIKIKENIERQNAAQLLMIKALMILFNQGTIAAYVYNKKSAKYGTYTKNVYNKKSRVVYTVQQNCSYCQSNLQETTFEGEPGKINEEPLACPVCGNIGVPTVETYDEEIPEIVGTEMGARSRTIIDVYSPLYVYLPFYAKNQEHCPYLRLSFEQHYSALKSIYPKLKRKGFSPSTSSSAESREVEIDVDKSNLCTVDCWWVRDWGFDTIDGKDDDIKKLKELFPDGYYCVSVNDEIVEIHNESLDDHWEISSNPLSNHVHGEPLGKSLAPVQEIQNEIVDLQIETFEHSIPETWARSDVVDFKAYGKSRAAPGMMYPAKADVATESLSRAFHTIKPATNSQETQQFLKEIQSAGQFVSGSFPSIYGGPAISGSKTAKEYSESRAMALQRLSIPWQTLKFWWAGTMSKAVPLYINASKESGEDEKIVEKSNLGFVNTWIKQSDLEGKIGRVEADAQEDLPQTPMQLKDTIVQLLSLNNEVITAALLHPENTPFMTKALGNPDLYIPNSDDRNKQYAEFAELLSGAAVEVNPSVDNHAIEAEVCRSFLVSPTGLMLKKSNPEGWKNIEDHMLQHKDAMKTMTSAPMEETENV